MTATDLGLHRSWKNYQWHLRWYGQVFHANKNSLARLIWTSKSLGNDQKVGRKNSCLIRWIGIRNLRDCLQIRHLAEQNGETDRDVNGTKAREEEVMSVMGKKKFLLVRVVKNRVFSKKIYIPRLEFMGTHFKIIKTISSASNFIVLIYGPISKSDVCGAFLPKKYAKERI